MTFRNKGGGTTGAREGYTPLEDASRGLSPYPAHTHIHTTLIHAYVSVLTSGTCQLLKN